MLSRTVGRHVAPRRGADDGHRARREERAEVEAEARRRPSPDDPIDAPSLERPGDDQALDLRTCPPRSGRRAARAGSARREVAHVAAATEDLHDPVGAAVGGLRGEELRERRLGVDDLRVGARCRPARRTRGSGQAGRGSVGRRVGEREADALEVVDPLRRTGPGSWPTRRPASAAAPWRPRSARRCGCAPRRTMRWSARRPGRRHRGPPQSGTRTSSSDELRVAVGEGVGVVGVVPGRARPACRSRPGRGSRLAARHRWRGRGRS